MRHLWRMAVWGGYCRERALYCRAQRAVAKSASQRVATALSVAAMAAAGPRQLASRTFDAKPKRSGFPKRFAAWRSKTSSSSRGSPVVEQNMDDITGSVTEDRSRQGPQSQRRSLPPWHGAASHRSQPLSYRPAPEPASATGAPLPPAAPPPRLGRGRDQPAAAVTEYGVDIGSAALDPGVAGALARDPRPPTRSCSRV